jgi:hypothetical protein
MADDIPIVVLRELLRYDPETGKLFWRERKEGWFPSHRACRVWNGQHSGKEALTSPHKPGRYLTGAVLDRRVSAHRVAWALHHGAWPSGHIDHINGEPTDNRIANLRVVTNRDNRRNMALPRDNKTGVMGVTWDAARGKWAAQIGSKPKRFLGRFDSFDDAVAARRSAEQDDGYHPNHGRERATHV